MIKLLIISLFIFGALFFGYFFIIIILSKLFAKPLDINKRMPLLSIIICSYNEEKSIRKKIEETLLLKYPEEKREIIVVDSGSTDKTEEILSELEIKKNIIIVKQPKRLGKVAAINEGLKRSSGEIIVLTDVDASLEKNSICKLIECLSDNNVGAAVGRDIIPYTTFIGKINSYFNEFFKERVRQAESLIDSTSYFSGELCAFKKTLVDELDRDVLADDIQILLKVRKSGFRCVSAREAFVYEKDIETLSGQFQHKRRTTLGIFQAVNKNSEMLFNSKYGFFGNIIFPSFIIRILLCPILLLIAEISFIQIIISNIIFFNVFKYYLWFFIGLIIIVTTFKFSNFKNILAGLLFPFIVQFSILFALWDFLLKKENVLWKKLKSG